MKKFLANIYLQRVLWDESDKSNNFIVLFSWGRVITKANLLFIT